MSTDYKKLFGHKDIILTNADREKLGSEVESVAYMTEHLNKKNRFIPPVDFSKPKQFARFGSAEKYYLDAIDRIYQTYPYDGSLRERIQWELSSSYLDLHIFENGYPRTNGYVILSAEGWGTQIATANGYGAPATSSYEYIFTKGGPNTSGRALGKGIDDTSGNYKSGYANLWDPVKNRESNLKIGGTTGNTVEFWLKKDQFLGSSLTNQEVLFDLYTSAFISSSVSYGRLTIEMSSSESASPFRVTYMSGTAGLSNVVVGSDLANSSVADGAWHHYAFTFKNTGSSVEVNLFVDGNCNQTIVTGSSISYVSGNINSTIGSLAAAPSGTVQPTLGWGKLSGSLDEFRFWKTKRTSQQIGRYYIEAIGGGTNTDTANTDLGVYYKFNAGITSTASVDKAILDYSGRISNGSFTGYNSSARSTGSALVDSGKVTKEFKDPILYSFHPDVASFRETKKDEGRVYDYSNNASIYHTLPAWIIEEDEVREYSPLRNLTQIVGSYFDSLASQIAAVPKLKHKSYLSSSYKPYPFSDRLLESVGFTYFPELFSDATALEQFKNRDDKLLFAQKLYDVKNRIYQNIYNNIVYIYKTKGTEKSFRNLIRCFGVDEEIYKINLYGNRVTYELKDNYSSVAEFKKYVNFVLTGTQEATVFPYSSSANTNSTSFISGTNPESSYMGFTTETEVAFPRRHTLAEVNTIVQSEAGTSKSFREYSAFKTASLFGIHQVDGTTENDLTWASNDYANFQVYAVREHDHSQRCYFKLTGVGATVMPTLTSSYFDEVFDDTRWTFSVAVKPNIYPSADLPSASSTNVTSTGYQIEFYGVEKVLDTIKNEFFLTSTISATDGKRFLNNPKSVYIGAHRTNFSGSLQEKSDGNISSTKVWLMPLATGTIQQHAQDVKNYGVPSPYRSAYLYQTSMTGTRIPEIHTLVLNWTFDTVTGSDSSGEFLGQDFSSGSTSLQNRYNWFGNIVGKQYLPKGYNFPTSFSSSINKKYVYSAKKQLPEFINSSNMVNILSDDDIAFNKADLLRPTNYYLYIEKSMYQTISEEMVRMFSSIKDFSNLVGEPVNKYRGRYKRMEKLRQLFFERVGNTPDLDKYIEFYKWVDQTLDVLLGYLVPASADISDQHGSNIRTLVESHILERNKYKWQFPTIEDKTPTPEGNILGINELLYDWEYGHPPLDLFNSKSIAFNGVNSECQLTVDDAANLSFGADGTAANEPSFTFSSWINMTDASRFYILGKRNTSTSKSEYVWYVDASDKLILLINDTNTTNFIANAADAAVTSYEGQWIHVCTTYDGSGTGAGIKMYINGSAVAMSTPSTGGSYTAMDNTNAKFFIGRSAENTANLVAEGLIDETAIFNKKLSSTEVSELYRSGHTWDLNNFFSAKDSLVSWWRMGDKATGTSPDYTIPDQTGDNPGTMATFAGSAVSGVSTDSAPSVRGATNTRCLWWGQRAERDALIISSSVPGVNSDKQAMLDSINNETNASNYTLYDSATSAAYSGSTFVIRRLGKPYKFKVDEARVTKGGTNYYPNKKVDIIRTETNLETSTNFLAAAASNVESFKDCNDELDLFTKRKSSFSALLRSELTTATDKNYFNAKGALFTPFSIYSASIVGGYNDTISNDFKTSVDITNLHEDTYGTLYGVPVQGPFTDKYVGGLQYRHVALTVDPTQTGSDNRPEGWSLSFNNNILTMSGPAVGVEGSRPKATRLRDETAKRPVNIRNIQQTTGSTIIGNYTKDYDLLMIGGRAINNRFFVKNDGVSASSVSSQIVSGVLDYNLPGAAQSERERQNVVINGLTSSARNDYIIVNRFSAPGDPSTMGFAYLDIEAQEYSIYNSLPWRNLIVRDGLQELYTDYAKQFGYFSDTQNSASYALAGVTYPGTSGSVNALDYAGSASYHKVNRNPRRTPRYADATTTSSYVEDTTYDNWHVQHQIPQTDLQYAWITASVIAGYTGSAYYGFEQPDFSNASLASTDITFCSSSDFGSYMYNPTFRGWGGTFLAVGSQGFIPTDFVGINANIYEPLTASSNTLGFPAGVRLVSTTTGEAGYIAGDDSLVDGAINTTLQLGAEAFNALILHRQGPYGWPSWKQIRGASHPVIRVHRKENRQSFLKERTIEMSNGLTGVEKTLVSQIEPPVTSKFKPMIHKLSVKTNKEGGTAKSIVHHTYGNEKSYFTQKVLGSIDLNRSNCVYIRTEGSDVGQTINQAQAHKNLMYNSLNNFIINPSFKNNEANPINKFVSLTIDERIYPREHYTYLSGTRQRTNFANNFWRDTRNARDTGLQTSRPNSQNYTVSQSMWSLDCRSITDQPPIPNSSNFTPGGGIEGELQNGYSLFFSATASPYPAATYNRRVPESASEGIVYAGDTLWETNTQAGIDPFYNTYADYVEDLKRIGKDYGVIPEFRISEHMDYYVNDNFGDFNPNSTSNPGYLTLTGSIPSSSNDASFYTVYSHSDFMKHFRMVRDDYANTAVPSEMILECKGLKKFLPYDGFYPSERTKQLAQLFSQSYGSTTEYSGTATGRSRWRTMMAPVFAPGILYNSIKSGIAVDYPINSTSGTMHITGSSVNGTTDSGDARLTGAFDHRVSFEALASPENFLDGLTVLDMEPHPRANYNNTGTFGGASNNLFKYAMNNFLAEVPTFFLKQQQNPPSNKMPYLQSAAFPDGNVEGLKAGQTYKMRIVLTDGKVASQEALDWMAPPDSSPSFIYNPPLCTMYNRSFDTSSLTGYEERFVGDSSSILAYGSSFGPPCAASSSLGYEASFEPYTPPSYNGYSHIDIEFTPEIDGNVELSDMLSQVRASASFFRECTRRGFADSTTGFHAMQLSESLNWTTKRTFEGGDQAWCIQPKWMSPLLDFNNSDITLPEGGGSGAVAKGMWHQYGSMPAPSAMTLKVMDVPGVHPKLSLRKILKFTGGSFTSGDTIQLSRLNPAGKTISEAIVAIPFFEDHNGKREYFNIPQGTIWKALRGKGDSVLQQGSFPESFDPVGKTADELTAATCLMESEVDRENEYSGEKCVMKMWEVGYKWFENNFLTKEEQPHPTESVMNMVQKMKKYVFPPEFDFLTYPHLDEKTGKHISGVAPMAMAIFEFSTQLTKQDLANIWQGLPPEKTTSNKSGQGYTVMGSEARISIDLTGKQYNSADNLTIEGFSLLNEWPTVNNTPGPFPSNIQWLVFKVKQKAQTNYYNLLCDVPDAPQYGTSGPGNGIPEYSFNWPYDFFSLVELAKIDSAYKFTEEETTPRLPEPPMEDIVDRADPVRIKDRGSHARLDTDPLPRDLSGISRNLGDTRTLQGQSLGDRLGDRGSGDKRKGGR